MKTHTHARTHLPRTPHPGGQVVSDPSGGAVFVADPKKPVGGHVLAHASTHRLSVRKGKAEQRLIKVVASPCLAESEASFQCTAEGAADYKD